MITYFRYREKPTFRSNFSITYKLKSVIRYYHFCTFHLFCIIKSIFNFLNLQYCIITFSSITFHNVQHPMYLFYRLRILYYRYLFGIK